MNQHDEAEVHPAPMESGGFYNDHAQPQAAGGTRGLPMIDLAFDQLVPTRPVTIADYGCAQGRNALAPVARALGHVRRLAGADLPVSVIHTDQPDNDFTALFRLLRDDPASYLKHEAHVYAAAVGRCFYTQILPAGTVDFGWCAYAAHWLSAAPARAAGHVWPTLTQGPIRARFARQAAADWRTFLAHRARELKPGGRLVVLQPSLPEGETATFPVLMTWVQLELEAMEQDGVITPAERARMTILVHERTAEEVRAPFASGSFAGLQLIAEEESAIPDPFWPAYCADGDAEALAERHLGFFRAPFQPSLLTALDARRDDASRATFAARLSAGLKRRMLAAPQALLAPMSIHAALFSNTGD